MWRSGNIMANSSQSKERATGKGGTFDSGGSMRRRKPVVNQMVSSEI